MLRLKAVVFDVDGVLKKGGTPIEGAVEAVIEARKKYKVFVLSNNSSHSRKSYLEHLNKMGFWFSEKEIYVSSHATALYLKERFKPTIVYCITSGGLAEEIRKAGFKVVEGKDGERADVVAVGFDTSLDYKKLSIAFRAIKRGAFFIASNDDKYYPVEDGDLPGAGLGVRGLEFATGVKPVVIGKPNTGMFESILRENRLSKEEVVIVGDSEETDIKMANDAGVKSVLIGKAKKYMPTSEIGSIKELMDVLHKLE